MIFLKNNTTHLNEKYIVDNISKFYDFNQVNNRDVFIYYFQKNKDFLEKIQDSSVPNWVVGTFNKNNAFVKEKGLWLYSEIEDLCVEKVSVHELVHIAIQELKIKTTKLVEEGIAMLVANQIHVKNNETKRICLDEQITNENVYFYSNHIFSCLLKIYSKKQLISIFKSDKRDVFFDMENLYKVINIK